ncbi:hypothetical protein ACJX0J_030486, partial [Zea mays]
MNFRKKLEILRHIISGEEMVDLMIIQRILSIQMKALEIPVGSDATACTHTHTHFYIGFVDVACAREQDRSVAIPICYTTWHGIYDMWIWHAPQTLQMVTWILYFHYFVAGRC